MDKEQALSIAEKYAEIVARELNPKQIMLFGSYVYGIPHKYSDIDIAVIYDKYNGPGNCWDGVLRLHSLLRSEFVDIEPHLLELSDDPWGFAHKIQKTGKVLYPKE